MGGFGSGRHTSRGTVERQRALDVRRLHREGLLRPGMAYEVCWPRGGADGAPVQVRAEADRLTLSYTARIGGAWQSIQHPVSLEWTGLHFGGRQPWFLCPACGRRVAILYSGSIFACRHCHGLAYASQRETPEYRAMRRADKLRDRLGWPRGIAHPTGDKPPGMHKATFDRLKAQHDALAQAALDGMARRLEAIRQRMR